MRTYRASFERGDLEGFLRHFSPAARENNRSGMGWLRAAYGKVFRETKARRLKINITLISQRGSRWNLQANYHLEFVYRDERHALISGQIDYTLERNGKSWRITQIRY
jgi:hypothetical protein